MGVNLIMVACSYAIVIVSFVRVRTYLKLYEYQLSERTLRMQNRLSHGLLLQVCLSHCISSNVMRILGPNTDVANFTSNCFCSDQWAFSRYRHPQGKKQEEKLQLLTISSDVNSFWCSFFVGPSAESTGVALFLSSICKVSSLKTSEINKRWLGCRKSTSRYKYKFLKPI